jgi:diguanylate cyclase (GGDEF)-like protein
VSEIDLGGIENRLELYPPEARQDIVQLIEEVRRLSARDVGAIPTAADPLQDPLTGLLNGGAYGVRFAMARARATRYNKLFAVMSIDVVFDTPHVGAEQLSPKNRELTIRHVAERLESCVRATDTLARVGDASFAVILEDLAQPDHAQRVQEIVQDALTAPLRLADRTVVPETRIAIDLYPLAPQRAGERVYN